MFRAIVLMYAIVTYCAVVTFMSDEPDKPVIRIVRVERGQSLTMEQAVQLYRSGCND